MIYVYRRVQLLKIRAHTQDLADSEARLADEGAWSIGEPELVDILDEEQE